MNKNLLMLPLTILCAPAFAAQAEKTLVCHVDSVVGTIDLISVPEGANHLGNENHQFDGLSDYEPSDAGATGEGKEDENGDGVADGCEPEAAACPCWTEFDLVVFENDGSNPVRCVTSYWISIFDSSDGALLSSQKDGTRFCDYQSTEAPGNIGKSVLATGLSPDTYTACRQIINDYCESN
jgi:hypothetical protein